jgi:tetratricopeptide (TPR) repeat protein
MLGKLYILIFLLHLSVAGFSQTDRADEFYNKALQFKKERNCTQAVEMLKKAIEIRPSFTDALYELGWCYNELKQYNLSIPVLTRTLSISSTDFRVIYELGLARYQTGLINEALNDFNKVIGLNPLFTQAYIARADLLKDAKENSASALKDYLKAIDLDSNSVKACYWAGWCNNDLGQFDKAITYLKKAVKLDPKNYIAFTELGFAYFSLNQFDEAVVQLQTAYNLNPKFENAIFYYGLTQVRLNKKAEALKKYNELVLLGSEYAITLLNEIKNMK